MALLGVKWTEPLADSTPPHGLPASLSSWPAAGVLANGGSSDCRFERRCAAAGGLISAQERLVGAPCGRTGMQASKALQLCGEPCIISSAHPTAPLPAWGVLP